MLNLKTTSVIVDKPVIQDGSIKGHVLFFFPMITKSAKITFMPVAEEMAKRGHQVMEQSLMTSQSAISVDAY